MKWSSASFDSLSLPWGVTAEQGTRAATAGDRRLVEAAELARYTPHWERVGAPEAGAELEPGSSGPVPVTRTPCAAHLATSVSVPPGSALLPGVARQHQASAPAPLLRAWCRWA